jgi:cephalosporin-C deacetylase
MPLIDFPLETLRTYKGLNPRPDDFDAYWDRGLAEMKALDPKLDLRPAPFRASFAECFDLFFTGVNGARVHAKLLKPKSASGKVPGVCVFHGYTGRSPDWSDLLVYPARGYVVAALDCRGQAGQSEDVGGVRGNTHHGHIIRGLEQGPDHLLYRSIFLDCAQLAGIVMRLPEVDGARVGSTGGSQGGALSIACAALEPRIKRCATMYPFLSDYRRVWEMDQAKDAYAELRSFFRHFDPRHEQINEWFRRLGYIDIQHLAPRIKGRVLMGTGLMDTVCPPSTQFAAYNKMTCEKDVLIYPDFGHEGLPGWNDKVFTFFDDL